MLNIPTRSPSYQLNVSWTLYSSWATEWYDKVKSLFEVKHWECFLQSSRQLEQNWFLEMEYHWNKKLKHVEWRLEIRGSSSWMSVNTIAYDIIRDIEET